MKLATVTKKVPITDAMRMDWVCRNITYLEHSVRGIRSQNQRQGGYWPQSMEHDQNPCDTAIEEFSNLQLDDYIDAMIEQEMNK